MSRSGAAALEGVEAIAFDLDGCLVLSDQPGGRDGSVLPGAEAVLRWAADTGRPRVILTNGSGQTPAVMAGHLRELGLAVADSEVITPPVVIARLCHRRWPGRPVLAFGGPGLVDVLRSAGVPLADRSNPELAAAVAIGWDTGFDYDSLQVAARAVRAGAEILVTSDARQVATSGGFKPGHSGFVAAGLSHVAGRPYEIAGKPSPHAMDAALDLLGRPADRVLVIGDDLGLEIAMAATAGAIPVLVTTGVSQAAHVATAPVGMRPRLVVDDLNELVDLLVGADRSHSDRSGPGRPG